MRLEITRKTNLAISVMGELSGARVRVSGKKLASAIGTTTPFLAQVISPLVRRGWVLSQPGRTGGYELAPNAAGVSVLYVIEAVVGPTDTRSCVMRSGACSVGDPCATHDAWSRARVALVNELAATPV
ncbi:MAG: Rrf2 family transcriptional regulator, partial [Acidimicrobiia bacterium]|nr:Rrf2 family transcriptional regulator [Acidimicrobiia bacterium]